MLFVILIVSLVEWDNVNTVVDGLDWCRCLEGVALSVCPLLLLMHDPRRSEDMENCPALGRYGYTSSKGFAPSYVTRLLELEIKCVMWLDCYSRWPDSRQLLQLSSCRLRRDTITE